MIQPLPDLAQFLRESIPDPRSIMNLRIQEKLGAVTFIWHGVEFLVKSSLNVFEVRGYQIYITGISTLLQLVLMRRTKNEKVLEDAAETISQSEDLIRVQNRLPDGMRLLDAVRQTLGKFVGQ